MPPRRTGMHNNDSNKIKAEVKSKRDGQVRHAAAVRQLSNGTNGDAIHAYSNGREHYSDS